MFPHSLTDKTPRLSLLGGFLGNPGSTPGAGSSTMPAFGSGPFCSVLPVFSRPLLWLTSVSSRVCVWAVKYPFLILPSVRLHPSHHPLRPHPLYPTVGSSDLRHPCSHAGRAGGGSCVSAGRQWFYPLNSPEHYENTGFLFGSVMCL